MKKIAMVLCMMFIAAGTIGCYRQIPIKEEIVPIDFKVIALDDPLPPQNEADIIIITHIKKVSYLLSPRTAETPYTFLLSINGQELKETLKGVEEIESNVIEERGKGIHYVLKKRLRLKPGSYKIILKSEDGRSGKIKKEFVGGKIYTLRFEPDYGPNRFGRPKHFREGVVDYRVYLDGNEISK